MVRRRAAVAVLSIVAMSVGAPSAMAGDARECAQPVSANVSRDAAPGELLVTFKEGVTADRAQAITAAIGVSLIQAMVGGRVHHVRVPDGVSVDSIKARYLAHPEVTSVEPNSIIRLR